METSWALAVAEDVPINSSDSSSIFFFIKSFCYLQVSPSAFTASSCVMYSAAQPRTVLIYLSVLAVDDASFIPAPSPPPFPRDSLFALADAQLPASVSASLCVKAVPQRLLCLQRKGQFWDTKAPPFPSGLHPGTLRGCQINTSALSSSDEVILKLCSASFLKIFSWNSGYCSDS